MKKIIIFIIMLFLINNVSVSAFPLFIDYEQEGVKVPIIMYHLVTKNGKYQGKFGISPEELEEDLNYLKENGYETVVVSDLIRFVNEGQPLPKKPIVLTFDDGLSSDYYYLFPLLEKYKMTAVSSLMIKYIDDCSQDENPCKKPYLVWEQVKEMDKSGLFEFQNHSYNLHGDIGSGKKKGESDEVYRTRLRNDIKTAQDKIKGNISKAPTVFAYPLGIVSDSAVEVLQEMGFSATLSCAEGINIIKTDEPDCLFHLKRNNRSSGVPVKAILDKVENSNKG